MNNLCFIKKLWKYIQPYRLRFLLSYLVLVVETISMHCMPLLIGDVVAAAVYQTDIYLFLKSAFLFAGVFCVQQGASFLQLQLWQRLNNQFVYDIRVACFEKVLRLRADKLTEINSGDVIRTIQGDAMDFHHIIQKNIMRSVNAILGTIFAVIMVVMIRFELALVIILMVPFAVFISHRMNIKIRNIAKESRTWEGRVYAWIWECFKGIQEIKLFAAEKNMVSSFQDQNEKLVEINYRQERQKALFEQIISIVFFMSTIIFYVVSAFFVAKQAMDIAGYVSVASFYALISKNVQRVFRDTVQYQGRKVAIERVFDLLETEYEDNAGLKELVVTQGEMEFKNVSFSYGNNNAVLSEFSAKMDSGTQVGVVGASGVGKSTLGALLTKFYAPQEGQIIVDGQDLSQCSYSSVRKSIGIVNQEAITFDGSIKYNVCFDEDADDSKVWKALEEAYLADDIRRIPGDIHASLGQDGVDLSGGQKQRLAVARMIYRNPQIVILDEATSALDVETEKAVQKALDKLAEGKTSLVISHRINSIIHSDIIWIIKEGVLLAKGTYEDLSAKNESFKELFNL